MPHTAVICCDGKPVVPVQPARQEQSMILKGAQCRREGHNEELASNCSPKLLMGGRFPAFLLELQTDPVGIYLIFMSGAGANEVG
jgi:hypothetical protein